MLGERASARAQYEQAVALDRGRLEREPNNATARLDLSHGLASIANLDAQEGVLRTHTSIAGVLAKKKR